MAGGPRILVVDDDGSTRELLQLALSDEGYEVLTAPNGAAAIDQVQTWRPDLILLNLRMPVMNGQSFAEAYQELPQPSAPIIVLSALSGVEDQLRAIDLDVFIAKPFDLDTLLDRIAEQLLPNSPEEPTTT